MTVRFFAICSARAAARAGSFLFFSMVRAVLDDHMETVPVWEAFPRNVGICKQTREGAARGAQYSRLVQKSDVLWAAGSSEHRVLGLGVLREKSIVARRSEERGEREVGRIKNVLIAREPKDG